MKKILIISLYVFSSIFSGLVLARDKNLVPYNIALSSGYVFKHDCRFKEVYGHGMVDIITTDFCYFPWKTWGFGAKMSYWRAEGRTTFLDYCTVAQEIPVTVYAKAAHYFNCDLQVYASLGGGFEWVKEKSYLGCVKVYKGIGEVEVGLHYPLVKFFNFTTAFRYVFPPQRLYRCKSDCLNFDFGGCDLRAGFSFLF